MNHRLPPRPRARRDQSPAAVLDHGPLQVGSSDAADVVDAVSGKVEAFEQLLAADASLDDDMRALLRQQFALAMDAGSDLAAAPDRAVWMDAVQALQASGELADDDANAVIRQISAAMEPLQRRESRIALEFSRRLASDGEQSALAWFRSQSRQASEACADDARVAAASEVVRPLRGEVVNSRSRRLRGPP